MAFVKVADVSALMPGETMVVEAVGRELALCNVNGQFHCIENHCPHSGGPLGEGWLEGDLVVCPWHAWEFNVRTGESPYTGCNVATYACKVEAGAVLVEI